MEGFSNYGSTSHISSQDQEHMSSVKLTLTVALQKGVGQGLCAHGIEHSDIQEVCGSRGIVTALVLKFTELQWGATLLLTSYLILNT